MGAVVSKPAAVAPARSSAESISSPADAQVAHGTFSAAAKGHAFALRRPVSRVHAHLCLECGCDLFAHARSEVSDQALMTVLDCRAEERASAIEHDLLVGGFKSVAAECARGAAVVVNCAGTRLHAFLPRTAEPFRALRTAGRLLDLEWEDSEAFRIDEAELLRALRWARRHTCEGRPLLASCAQGKSRSGTFAAFYLMATRDLPAHAALEAVRAKRPLVEPNPGFQRQLRELEAAVRAEGRRWKLLPSLLSPGRAA